MNTQIGRAVFNRKEYEQNIEVVTIGIMRTLNKANQWKIEHKEFHNQKWDVILGMMVQTDVEKMSLIMTYFPPILKSIAHIRFPSLMELNLEVNQIESIEPLASLSAPILQKLSLSNNRITSIKPLSKMNLKYLTSLSLDGNHITDFYPMTRASFPKKMERILLQTWDQRKMQVCWMGWALKARPKEIAVMEFLVDRENRLKDEGSLRMMTEKYRKIRLC